MRQTTILTLFVAAVMSVALFYLKYEVANLEDRISYLNSSIVDHEEGIHVLNAEWSHLNNVSRIKDLASRYLQMYPTNSDRIKSIDDLINIPSSDQNKKEQKNWNIKAGNIKVAPNQEGFEQ